jgi:hypothetical protein
MRRDPVPARTGDCAGNAGRPVTRQDVVTSQSPPTPREHGEWQGGMGWSWYEDSFRADGRTSEGTPLSGKAAGSGGASFRTMKTDPSNNRKRAEAFHGHTGPLSPSGESGSVLPDYRRDRVERGVSCCGVSIMLERNFWARPRF